MPKRRDVLKSLAAIPALLPLLPASAGATYVALCTKCNADIQCGKNGECDNNRCRPKYQDPCSQAAEYIRFECLGKHRTVAKCCNGGTCKKLAE